MPTGYTAEIGNGISFNDFVMRCARGMGACVMMRDEPMDAPIPDKFEPSSYHSKALENAKSELNEYTVIHQHFTEQFFNTLKLRLDKANKKANLEYDKKIVEVEKNIAKDVELKKKYVSMLKQAEAWQPPTEDHVGLKDFMIEQIESSMKFDCDIYTVADIPEIKLKTAEQWFSEKTEAAIKNINYHRTEMEKENEREASRTQWVKDLRESLKPEEEKPLDRECPKCGSKLKRRNGRYGRFIGCSNFPLCEYSEHAIKNLKGSQK